MKKLIALVLILVLGMSAVAFAADSPSLVIPPETTPDTAGIWVIHAYNADTEKNLADLATFKQTGKPEIDFFNLSAEDLAKVQEKGFVPAQLTVDDFLHTTVGGYVEKPAGISYTAKFVVPFAANAKVLVLMGVGPMPGPFAWTVQEATVNPDGTLHITLVDFPAEPFMLALLS